MIDEVKIGISFSTFIKNKITKCFEINVENFKNDSTKCILYEIK